MTTSEGKAAALARIREEVLRRRHFLISSHARPDGDSIGSQLAMAYALKSMGKNVRLVNRDSAPPSLASFPGVSEIAISEQVEGDFDAAIVLECSDLSRTGVSGIDRYFVINIDHHPGNAMYGAINWFEASAAACGEMVFDVIMALGVPFGREIATHIYLAILADTGGFHYSHISPRTFDICRQAVEAGVDPQAVARSVFDNNSVGRLKLFGAVLGTLELDASGRLAIVHLNQAMMREAGGTFDDTDGLVNLPLTVKEIEAVVFFKETEPGFYRVSLRSKGDVDVSVVAKQFGGGGHKNAAGCTLQGRYDEVRPVLVSQARRAVEISPAAGG